MTVLDLANPRRTLEGIAKYDAYLVCFTSPVPVPHTTERRATLSLLLFVLEWHTDFLFSASYLALSFYTHLIQFILCQLQASLSEMIPPGCLVMLTPVVVGVLFGTRTLAGVLAGALVSGVQMAVSMSNTGGAWDNAKKYVEVEANFTHQLRVCICVKVQLVLDSDSILLGCDMLLVRLVLQGFPRFFRV